SEESSPEELDDLYVSKIIEPVYQTCFEGGEFAYDFSVVTDAPSDFAKIQEVIDQMDFEHISSLIEEALVKSSDFLPSENETIVCVFPVVDGDNEAAMFVPGTGKIIVPYGEYFY